LKLSYRQRDTFCLLDEGDRPTTPKTKNTNRSQKTTPLELSNEHRNKLNQN
jgi:hypothetical protein